MDTQKQSELEEVRKPPFGLNQPEQWLIYLGILFAVTLLGYLIVPDKDGYGMVVLIAAAPAILGITNIVAGAIFFRNTMRKVLVLSGVVFFLLWGVCSSVFFL